MSAERVILSPFNDDFKEVKSKFDRYNTTFDKKTQKKTFFVIVKIEKVINYKLYQKFLQKEKEYISKYGCVQKFKLFHGTKEANISSILESNLDVKRYGQNIGCRFGAGVSFSASASYASHYCDKNETDTMLLCEVLISNIVEVREIKNKNLVIHEPPHLPNRYPLRYDTSAKNKTTMDVIVKFERDSFYPAYVITFERRLKRNPSSSYVSHSHVNVSQSYSNVNPSNSHLYQTQLYVNPSRSHAKPITSHVSQGLSNDDAIHFNVSSSKSNVNSSQSSSYVNHSHVNVSQSYSNVNPSNSYLYQTQLYVNPSLSYAKPITSHVPQGLSNVSRSQSNVNPSQSCVKPCTTTPNDDAIHFNVSHSQSNVNPSQSSVKPCTTAPNVYPSSSNVNASLSSAIQGHSYVNPVTRTTNISRGLSNVYSSHSNVNASLSSMSRRHSHASANPSNSVVHQSHSENHSSFSQNCVYPQSSDSHDPKVGCCVIL